MTIFTEGQWIRTCQECSYKQVDQEPDPQQVLSDAYCNRECKRCKSTALDYGRTYKEFIDDIEQDD